MLNRLRRNPFRLAKMCLALRDRTQRLGCFHGLGSGMLARIADEPRALGAVCGGGSVDAQTVCIEGAIEKLADMDAQKALMACQSVRPQSAAVCNAAAREKMYRLTKPSLPLYWAP